MATTVLLLALIATSMYATAGKRVAPKGLAVASPAAPRVFDVTKFGAKAKDKLTEDGTNSLNALAFGKAWQAACHSRGREARVVIPKGKFVLGPIPFAGPCNATVTIDIQGTVIANPESSIYFDSYWLLFENVNGVTITGTGTIDGDAISTYQYCATNPDCGGHPNIKFMNATNSVVEGVNSINPMFAHVYIGYSNNVTVRNMKMTAPENSVRTDGVHMVESQLITVSNNVIATGTDCVAIGQRSKDITITDLTCGPGNGISVGSLLTLTNIGTDMGNSLDVERVLVKKCNFIRTTSGLTIKTLLGEKGNKVSAVTFEDLVMDHVKNPITILQEDKKNPSLHHLAPADMSVPAKISDIHFKNIKGTSITKEFVNFSCSPLMPCEGVEVADVDLVFDAKAVVGTVAALLPTPPCLNAKVLFNGIHNGITC